MVKRQLFDLMQGIKACADLSGIKFAYALKKNKDKIERIIVESYDILRPLPDYNEYEEQRVELAESLSKRDDEGSPMVENDKYVIKNKKKFEKELAILRERYKDAIAEKKAQFEAYEKCLDEEVSIDFHKIQEKDIPKDISARQLEIISRFMYDAKSKEDEKTEA